MRINVNLDTRNNNGADGGLSSNQLGVVFGACENDDWRPDSSLSDVKHTLQSLLAPLVDGTRHDESSGYSHLLLDLRDAHSYESLRGSVDELAKTDVSFSELSALGYQLKTIGDAMEEIASRVDSNRRMAEAEAAADAKAEEAEIAAAARRAEFQAAMIKRGVAKTRTSTAGKNKDEGLGVGSGDMLRVARPYRSTRFGPMDKWDRANSVGETKNPFPWLKLRWVGGKYDKVQLVIDPEVVYGVDNKEREERITPDVRCSRHLLPFVTKWGRSEVGNSHGDDDFLRVLNQVNVTEGGEARKLLAYYEDLFPVDRWTHATTRSEVVASCADSLYWTKNEETGCYESNFELETKTVTSAQSTKTKWPIGSVYVGNFRSDVNHFPLVFATPTEAVNEEGRQAS